MPMVTKIALLNLFSNIEVDSPFGSFDGLPSPFKTGCSPEKSSGGDVRRKWSSSSISSIASSQKSEFECTSCPNYVNCGGDPNYDNKNKSTETTPAVSSSTCNPSLREKMRKKLEW